MCSNEWPFGKTGLDYYADAAHQRGCVGGARRSGSSPAFTEELRADVPAPDHRTARRPARRAGGAARRGRPARRPPEPFAEATSYEVRGELQHLIERDLLGPWDGPEERFAPGARGPRDRYLVGMLGAEAGAEVGARVGRPRPRRRTGGVGRGRGRPARDHHPAEPRPDVGLVDGADLRLRRRRRRPARRRRVGQLRHRAGPDPGRAGARGLAARAGAPRTGGACRWRAQRFRSADGGRAGRGGVPRRRGAPPRRAAGRPAGPGQRPAGARRPPRPGVAVPGSHYGHRARRRRRRLRSGRRPRRRRTRRGRPRGAASAAALPPPPPVRRRPQRRRRRPPAEPVASGACRLATTWLPHHDVPATVAAGSVGDAELSMDELATADAATLRAASRRWPRAMRVGSASAPPTSTRCRRRCASPASAPSRPPGRLRPASAPASTC